MDKNRQREITGTDKDRRRWTGALLCCAITGLASGIAGFGITAAILLGAATRNSRIDMIGTVLVLAAFASAIAGAHAMDKISEIEKGKNEAKSFK